MNVAVHDSVRRGFDPDLFVDYLAANGFDTTHVESGSAVDAYDCVVTFGHDEMFFDSSWVHCIRSGIDEFPLERYAETGTQLTNSAGIHATPIGETVAGMMLSFARRLHRYRDHQRRKEWRVEPYDGSFSLSGETVCVVGLGTLGTGVVRRANALGMDVLGVRRAPVPTQNVDTLYHPDELEEAISDARFVVLCVPLTDETEGMIGATEFAAMREDGILINVARGGVVDSEALISALVTEAIAGAGLDAFVEEPLPAQSPLWEFDEVIITPHVGARSNTYHEKTCDIVITNADRLERGDELFNRVA